MKKTFIIALLLLFGLGSSALSEGGSNLVFARTTPSPSPTPTPDVHPQAPSTSTGLEGTQPDPVVKIRPQRSYTAKRIALLPLELPSYVMMTVTYPLHELSKLIERKRVAQRLGDYFLKSDLVFYPILQAGGGDGFGGGFGFIARNMGNTAYDLHLNYTFFSDLDQRAGLSLKSGDYYLGNRPTRWAFYTRFRDKNNAPFYGTGPDSLEADKSLYGTNQVRIGVEWEYEFFGNLALILPLEYLTVETKPDLAGPEPSVEQVFPISELTAFDQRTQFMVFGAELLHDTRDSKNVPSRGGYRSVRFTRYQGLNEPEFSFNEFEVDVRQYFRLWTPRHVFVVRNDWYFQQSTGSGDIPYNLLRSLDVSSPLRGFKTGRFRDRSSVLFNLEYRYPIWDYIDGTIFFDNGKVFSGIKDFSFSDWRYTVGGGLRFFYGDSLLMRVQAGYGGEGVVVMFRLGEVL